MASRDYERLSIEDFGRHLILSDDLDPVYTALNRVSLNDWDMAQVKRFMTAYWCFYHVGFSAWMSHFKENAFWSRLYEAAINVTESPVGGPWPRGSERRHFRAQNAIKGASGLIDGYHDAEGFVDYCAGAGPQAFRQVRNRVLEHSQFGPWMAFKVADMIERVLKVPVSFDRAEVFMFDDPRKAAISLYKMRSGLVPETKLKDETGAIETVCEYLTNYFSTLRAPGLNRPIGLQEVETVLCKWKSHMNGHYPVNKDTVEIREGLTEWARLAPSCRQFLNAMSAPTPYGGPYV